MPFGFYPGHGQPGSYQLAGRVSTVKRACVDLIWWGILLDGWQPRNNASAALLE
jgi:hypothetical protein